MWDYWFNEEFNGLWFGIFCILNDFFGKKI